MKIQIEKEKLQAAYKNACGCVKDAFEKLFGEDVLETAKPTLDDYKTIKSYEDACDVLGLSPILSENRNKALCAQFPDHYDFRQNMPKHIIALMKLEIISRALWGKSFQPKPDAEGKEIYWYPWFALYTKDEVKQMSDEDRKSTLGALFGGHAGAGAYAGFGYPLANGRSSYSSAHLGFRLCQETEEKAAYFGRQFIELWAEYLAYGFKVTEHLK
ncbi:hypothetical protein H7U35_04140 [Mediterranea massiliensis]|uniref:Uncharacterized protein n=1 Tax=Mediterranea massiliensis TaxID=1841865 RepID=A0ABS2DY37_9BACT|nr:hypothetical protein [Mediterranea massiliensis]MBM6734420.1 hypothetical protein [Mediterranea massiliensis]